MFKSISNFIWKYIDKFLKKLKTDRNTFFTYLLTLITVYICIDRIVEMLFLGLSGISVSYWGPFAYTFALLCPIFAFLFGAGSKFATDDAKKFSLFVLYYIALYIIALSMIVQWSNQFLWVFLFSLPNYSGLVGNFLDVIKPAFTAIAWYFPIVTIMPVFKKMYTGFADTKDIRDSVADYNGISLEGNSDKVGPYTCEMFICRNGETGQIIKTPESRRFEATLIVGVSGSGKTTMAFEPMIARDIEKKFFLQEASKELGFTALKTGLASIREPFSNEYLNSHFSLDMLEVKPGKEKIFNSYLKKLIYNTSGKKNIYKKLGLTYIAPDYETISHISEVLDNYEMPYNIVDPNDMNSIGLNPFVFDDPVKTSISISAVLKRMYETNEVTVQQAFYQNITTQAIENLALLLKEVYPKTHNGLLPNLEDLLMMLNNFDLVEKFCEKMKKFPELAEKYHILLTYFQNNFYTGSSGYEDTKKALQAASAQLENLLRFPGVRNILCNRTNNINFDKALADGEITLICTRRGDLGAAVNKAFGLFTLLLMQHSIISRPGTEKTRIPHFLYIDEFPPYVCKATEDFFTLFRKYRVGLIISAQNLSQFGTNNSLTNSQSYRQTILANCTTKIVFGNNTPEDNEWWEKEFGDKREWSFKMDYQTDGSKNNDGNPAYSTTYKDISWAYKLNFKAGKIQSQKFKAIIYKTRDIKGKMLVGKGKLDFLESKYKEKHPPKQFNFSKYYDSATTHDSEKKDILGGLIGQPKFDPLISEEDGPIKYNSTDAKFFYENEGAITYNIPKNNNNK
ncbi:MAG: TraM recognition domain-containing protein [Clostridia bacterium]